MVRQVYYTDDSSGVIEKRVYKIDNAPTAYCRICGSRTLLSEVVHNDDKHSTWTGNKVFHIESACPDHPFETTKDIIRVFECKGELYTADFRDYERFVEKLERKGEIKWLKNYK